MNDKGISVAVTSRSFSSHPVLRRELLEKYPRTTFNESGISLHGDNLFVFLSGHDRAIIALERIDESLVSRLPLLKVISKYGVGLDTIDLKALDKYGVKLGWTAGVNRQAVAELAISMMIALLRHLPLVNDEVKAGVWRQHVGRELSNQTVGIIGCGNIGKCLAGILAGFGSKILAYDLVDFPEFYTRYGIIKRNLEEILRESDIVTLHLPLDDTTQNIISAERLELMKRTAILVNVARGGILDESHLKKMLVEKRLAGAALDVFATEPPGEKELLKLENVFVTSHIGGSTEESILAMGRASINGLDNCKLPGKYPELKI